MELAERYACPVLGLFGGADPSIHPEDVEAFRIALDRAGVSNELVVYDGAPHSFFDRSHDRFRDACDDAWRRVLSFMCRLPPFHENHTPHLVRSRLIPVKERETMGNDCRAPAIGVPFPYGHTPRPRGQRHGASAGG